MKIARYAPLLKALVVLFTINLISDHVVQLSQVNAVVDSLSLSDALAMSRHLPKFWTGLLVPLCYLAALWATSNWLKNLDQTLPNLSDAFKGLVPIGNYLVYAAIAALFLVPTLESWINLGGRGFKLEWAIEPVVIGLIGSALKLVGKNCAALDEGLAAKSD